MCKLKLNSQFENAKFRLQLHSIPFGRSYGELVIEVLCDEGLVTTFDLINCYDMKKKMCPPFVSLPQHFLFLPSIIIF